MRKQERDKEQYETDEHFGGFPYSAANRPRCAAGDTKCLVPIINQYIRQSANGIRDINLAPVDPLFVPELNIVQGNGPVNIQMYFKNVNFHGFSTSQVTRVVGFGKDPKTTKFELYGRVNRLTIVGSYKLNGRVILLPVQGAGPANMTLENLDVSIKCTQRVENRGGTEYLQFSKLTVDFTPTRFTMHFGNLFNGNQALGSTTNQFFNENSINILNEIKPTLRNAIGNILMKTALKCVPYRQLVGTE
ncbi:Protein takeout [Pseudolycoriella hygida]|uniref:Protein takeout n=1 Tax=Pseudolycoriella hygida TaxID=35572 RepID=A0A9Q0RX45_9DIPT|nr:Protein takeout [Pseudolycoriella hygida]